MELILAGLGFTADESNKIVETGVIRFYPRNSIVLTPPFNSKSLFIIIEGRVYGKVGLREKNSGRSTALIR